MIEIIDQIKKKQIFFQWSIPPSNNDLIIIKPADKN